MRTTATDLGSGLWDSEQLVLCRDDSVGLHAVIAIDDTTLGPGLGGVRLKRYPSDEAGVRECRRLAKAMTLKNAIAELPFGGAKSIIFDRGPVRSRSALMRRFGEFVTRAAGAYLPGVDMGTTVRDLAAIGESGADVACSVEDPSPYTARGVWAAIRAAVENVEGSPELRGVSVLVQGAGHVGSHLAQLLAGEGARVMVADLDEGRAERLARAVGGTTVAPDAVIETPCDVLAPCAAAGVIAAGDVERLDCQIVAGGANDTLADRGCADLLAQRRIVYVPDFVANAGGVIHIEALRAGWSGDRLDAAIAGIGDRVRELLGEAESGAVTPLVAAEARAARRLRDGARGRAAG